MRSTNPDKVRHATTSLRELLTQVLHSGAPDIAVEAELKDPRWYSNGRPTRKARIYFILTQKYGDDILLDFLEKDIEAIESLFSLLHKGTHEVASSIGGDDLAFIVKRVRLTICQLLNAKTS
jgi:hypothetical protein